MLLILQKEGGVMSYNGDFNNDFGVAAEFGNIIIPILNSHLKNNAEVIHTEHLKEVVAQLLDRCSGIDGILKMDNNVAGVALRVQQHSAKNWGTFTIRYSRHTGSETEYSKRKRQIYASNVFYPHYTCQAYLDNENKLIGGAFCLTKDLFDVIIPYEPFTEKCDVYLQQNFSDGNTFIVCPFSKIERILLF